VFLPRDTIISKIVCGKSHSAFFTEDNRVFVFGSNQHNQLARKTDYDLDVCSPLQVELNLTGGEKIVDIKAKFDRTCVITD
jgi:alpha-tubulin suppressor-like RCC1 family protein